MKHIGIILLAWLSITNQAGQSLYVCKNARVSIYSSAPIEDIRAVSTAGASVYNPSTGELDFSIGIRSFQFEKALMQEHFNSDYMESDKFPKATFKGKIVDHIDMTKDGTYQVTVTGDLNVHGITQKRTFGGKLEVKGGSVTVSSEFLVKCADHHIDIPSIVFHHIAETIQVNVSGTYSLYKNNQTK